jgi:hypothetical protein
VSLFCAGLFIEQATAFTVLIFAPTGTLLTKFCALPLAQYLCKYDEDANWNINESRYYTDDEIKERKAAADAAAAAIAAKQALISDHPHGDEEAVAVAVPDSNREGDDDASAKNSADHHRRPSETSSHTAGAAGANSSHHNRVERSGSFFGGLAYHGLDGSQHSTSQHAVTPSTRQMEESQLEEEPTVLDLLSVICTRIRSATTDGAARRRSSTQGGSENATSHHQSGGGMVELIRNRRKSRGDSNDHNEDSGGDSVATRHARFDFSTLRPSGSDSRRPSSQQPPASAASATNGTDGAASGTNGGVNGSESSSPHRSYELVSHKENLDDISTPI